MSHFDPAAAPGVQWLDAAAPEAQPPEASGPAAQDGGLEALSPLAHAASAVSKGNIRYSFGI